MPCLTFALLRRTAGLVHGVDVIFCSKLMVLWKAGQLPALSLGKYGLFGLAEGLNRLCAVILLLDSNSGKLHDKMRKT